jgi:hypothetical protein
MSTCNCPTCDPDLLAALAPLDTGDRTYLIQTAAAMGPEIRAALMAAAEELAEAAAEVAL